MMRTTAFPTPPSPPDVLPRRRTWAWILALLLLVAINVAVQAVLHQDSLGDTVLMPRHPSAHDAFEYTRAAGSIARGEGFVAAFGEGWRMPGYSLFLSPFFALSESPLRTARLAQIALTALIPLLFFFTLTRVLRSRSRPRALLAAWIGAAVTAVWPPLYHYSSALLAEAPSLFLMFLLLWVLSRSPSGRPAGEYTRAMAVGVILAALVYLKPNHVLLLLPVTGFLLATCWNAAWSTGRKSGRRSTIGHAAVTLIVCLVLLGPWSIFISRQHGTFIPLTLVSGYNLHLGTGVAPIGDRKALPFRAAQALGLQDAALGENGRGTIKDLEEGFSPTSRDSAYVQRARTSWGERPGELVLHGAAKVLHAFGFSFRGARDVVMVLFFLATMAASMLLWRERQHGVWVLFLGLSLLGIALQAFVYLPNQRFKTVLFDPPALLVLALSASCLSEKVREKVRDKARGKTHAAG